MDSSPGGLVMPHLLNWVSLHFPACEERARYMLVLHKQSLKDLSLLPTTFPGRFSPKAATAPSSTATTGRRSHNSSSKVELTRLATCSGSTPSSRRTRSPPWTSCCARCPSATLPPLPLSSSSPGGPGKSRSERFLIKSEFNWFHLNLFNPQVTSRLQEGDFAAFPELTTVAQLLAGQEEALHQAAERCETW